MSMRLYEINDAAAAVAVAAEYELYLLAVGFAILSL